MLHINRECLQRIQIWMLYFAIIFMPVLTARKGMPLLGQYPPLWFVCIGMVVFFFEWYIYRFKINKFLLLYSLAFLGWNIASSMIGALKFPYYSLVDMHGVGTIIARTCMNYAYLFDEITIKKIFMICTSLKDNVTFYMLSYGLLFWVYHLKKENSRFSLKKVSITMAVSLFVYAIPEILYLKFHISSCYRILEIANGFIYDIDSHFSWYPAVIYPGGRLKSYAIEPATLGACIAFLMPFFWDKFEESKNIKFYFLYSMMIMLIIMSKSYAAMVLLVGLYGLYFIGVYFGAFSKLNVGVIVICVFIGVGLANLQQISLHVSNMINHTKIEETIDNKKETIDKVLDKTFNPKVASRSTTSRLYNIKSHLNVFKQNWFCGTGLRFKDAYVRYNLADNTLSANEMKMLTEKIDKKGIPSGGYGNVNNYIYIATNFGVIGFILYFGLFLFFLYRVIWNGLYKYTKVFTLSAIVIVSMVGMMGGGALISSFIVLGMGFAVIDDVRSANI